MHKSAIALKIAAAEHQRGAAGSSGNPLVGNKRRKGAKDGFGHGQRSRHVRVYCRRETRVDHTARAKGRVDHASQTLVDRYKAVDQCDETVNAGSAHQGRADVGRSLGLIAATAKVKMKFLMPLCDFNMDANWPL